MRGRKIFPVLALVIFLAVPAYTTAQIIDDDYPYNLVNPWAHFDYQDYDTWSEGYPGGSEGRSGAYFNIGVAVLPDPTRDHLKDYGEVIRIRARHVDSGRVFDLEPSECTDLLGTGLQNWSLQLRPKTWMFEGTWRFIMIYNHSTDPLNHRQRVRKVMGTVAFPMRPSYIQINTEESKFVVSWSAIGDPATGRFEYCVRIYDVDGVCIETQLLESTYDPVLNRGSFQIDRGAYNRRRIRLENRILIDDQMSRAFTRLRLPE